MNTFNFCKGTNDKSLLSVHWFAKRTKILGQK
jgi:hypothetical protein